MLKTFSKYAHVALALCLILPLASMPADAKPSGSSSFKSGFSSQRSSSPKSSFSSSRSKPSPGGFGSFSRRPSETAPAEPRKSESAMSRKLDRERSEANALRTLDERRAAQAAQERNNAARSAPGGTYADDRRAPPQGNGYGYGYGQAPAPAQPPVIVQQNGGSGLGHIVAGAILAKSMSNAHANNNNNGSNNNGNNNGGNGAYYPAPSGSAGDLANQAGAGSVGAGPAVAPGGQATPAAPASKGSVLGTIVWLCVLALIAWGIWRVLKRRKARREADKPNYSFERN